MQYSIYITIKCLYRLFITTTRKDTIASPYVMEKIRFIPTGGIKPATASVYLSSPLVLSIGGTWIATQSMIENGEWDTISMNAAEAVTIAAMARGAAV